MIFRLIPLRQLAVRLGLAIALPLLVSACAVPPETKDYSRFREAAPRSIAVVPAVNKSLEVTAPDYYLSTISIPLAERGYYVFPVHLMKRVMEDDGLSDADMVHAAPVERVAEMFGADAVLYVTIQEWQSTYAVLATETRVTIDYALKHGETGETLWSETQTMIYAPKSGGGGLAGLIADAIVAAIERAAPNYIPLAHQANAFAVYTPGRGLPAGPYAANYNKDGDMFPSHPATEKKAEDAKPDTKKNDGNKAEDNKTDGKQGTAPPTS